jgi:hypothetical protein
MCLCIDSSVIGTEKHLLCNSGIYSWIKSVPNDSWHLSGKIKNESQRCFDTLLRLNDLSFSLLPDEKYLKMMSSLESDSIQFPWKNIMSSSAHRDFVKKIANLAAEAYKKVSMNYYEGTWVPCNKPLNSLNRAKIDKTRLKNTLTDNAQNPHVIKSFQPTVNSDYADTVVYNRFGTLTGRLTVTKGPQILTLKRNCRDIIVSESENSTIMSIDFSALEPRILLYESGKDCLDEDLYRSISSEINRPRNDVKLVIISELYGSSKRLLGDKLKLDGDELDNFVKYVKQYFNTKSLLERLKKQVYELGYIENHYGRRIKIDDPTEHILINYYTQSTGVDVSLLGFGRIIDILKEQSDKIKPLYLLHDALILDVPNSQIDNLKQIKSIFVPGYTQAFPLKIEPLYTND